MEKASPCRRWLLASTAIGLAFTLTLSQPAIAVDECGSIVGNSVTCTPAGNNYTSGTTYNPTDDLTMVVEDGVTVTPSSGKEGINVSFSSSGLYDLDLRLYDSDPDTDISTTGSGDEGIVIRNARNVVLYNEAEITAAGNNAIEVRSTGVITMINSGTLSSGDNAIHSFGALNLTNSGSITTSYIGIYNYVLAGDTSIVLTETSSIVAGGFGIHAYADGSTGNVYVSNSGSIITQADSASGIYLSGIQGYATVVQSSTGSILTEGDNAHGIFLNGIQNDAEVRADGSITTTGDYSSAIRVSEAYANVAISVSGGIRTLGKNSPAIVVLESAGKVSISAQIADGADVMETIGENAHVIDVENTNGDVAVYALDGDIISNGDYADAIRIMHTGGNVSVLVDAEMSTQGEGARGVYIQDSFGSVDVDVGGFLAAAGAESQGVRVKDSIGV
jgi:hypothetical protein